MGLFITLEPPAAMTFKPAGRAGEGTGKRGSWEIGWGNAEYAMVIPESAAPPALSFASVSNG
jgi:hypothetical protein